MSGTPGASLTAVTVVIVSYNTRALLAQALRAVLASTGVSLEVFVVDNGSADGSADMVRSEFPSVRLVRNGENRGFAAANNLALATASARVWLLLNPDTLVRPTTVAELRDALLASPDIGIVGPRVENEDGTLQSCGYWYPTLMREVRLSKNVNRGLKRVIGDEPAPPDSTQPQDVDWVDGCCLMIRREVAEQIGLLDEQFFLYAEELDWCRSARRAGWRVRTCPQSVMTHLLGRSSQQVKAEALALLTETRLRYYYKQDGGLTAAAVAIVYALGCLKRWRHEPDKSRAKLHGIRRWVGAWRTGRLRPLVPRVSCAAGTVGN
jgi:GT2 family glycosyltransferase